MGTSAGVVRACVVLACCCHRETPQFFLRGVGWGSAACPTPGGEWAGCLGPRSYEQRKGMVEEPQWYERGE